jgi:ATP-binding cassette subfamily B protein
VERRVRAEHDDPGERGPAFAADGGSMWRLYAEYGRGNARYAALGTTMALLSRAAGLVPALLLGLAIDAALLGTRPYGVPGVPAAWLPTTPDGQLRLTAALLVAATLLGAGATWLGNYGWNRFAQNVQHALRVDAYESLQAQDRAFFDRSRTGELLSVLNNDVNRLESFLTDGVDSALRVTALVVGVGAVMVLLNPALAAVTLLAVPVLVAFTAAFVRRVQPLYARTRASVGDLNVRLENNVGGITAIKTEGAEAHEAGRVRTASRAYYDANWAAIRTRIRFFPGLSAVSGLSFALTFAVGSFWVLRGPPGPLSGTLSPGEFVTFMLYTQTFVWPLAQAGQVVNAYQRAKASSERVYGLLAAEPTVRESPDAVEPATVEGRVDVENVAFGYGEEPVVTGVDLSLAPGEHLGVVGPTGSGKSTLLKLLLRLYDPDEGAVRLDGVDLRELSTATLRRSVGYVAQEPYLFDGTVRENVAYGTFDATDEAVETATRRAAAHEFVTALPEGYDTVVGERGVRLSGGQRQRIAIARAILKDAPVLVLDEATSHVDTETEALIARSLREHARDRTTITVAHRLSTVRDTDRIVVLDGGRIVESGTHEDLLATGGLYADLWRVQVGEIDALSEAFFADAERRRGAVEARAVETTTRDDD